jgi:hypothetical protein
VPLLACDRHDDTRRLPSRRWGAGLYGDPDPDVALDCETALIWGMTRKRQTSLLPARLALAGAAALLVLPACSGSGGESTTSSSVVPPSSESTTSTSVALDSDVQLRAAVRAFWDLYLELGARTGRFDAATTRRRIS